MLLQFPVRVVASPRPRLMFSARQMANGPFIDTLLTLESLHNPVLMFAVLDSP